MFIKMKKFGFIMLHILIVLVALFIVTWSGLMIAREFCYSEFLEKKETVCRTPAIHDGLVPQSVSHISDDTYIFSGYNGDQMELYLSVNNTPIKIIPTDQNGEVRKLHGCGVTVVKDIVYVTGSDSLLIFNLDDILAAKDGDSVTNVGEFPINVIPAFCFTTDNKLYVGEFYDGVHYTTDPTHHVTTTTGEQHYALTAVYSLDETGALISEIPDYYISTRTKVQGFAVSGDTYILSSSYGLASSELDFYNGLTDSGRTIDIAGKVAPLYHLDSTTHTKNLSMPAMSEGIDIVGDRVIISFESACNKYFFGKFFFATDVVSYPVSG